MLPGVAGAPRPRGCRARDAHSVALLLEQPRVLPAAVWLQRLSETAERLMVLAEAIPQRWIQGFSFRDLAAETGIRARACITISHQGRRRLPLLPGVTETISLP